MEMPHAQCRSGDRIGGARRCGPVRARGGDFAAQPLSSPFAAFGRSAIRSLSNGRGERTSEAAAGSVTGRLGLLLSAVSLAVFEVDCPFGALARDFSRSAERLAGMRLEARFLFGLVRL